ncbi:MAG: hydrogen gas-evolving membrane-bound hydrogenase subunit E [Myxococcota bacterium]
MLIPVVSVLALAVLAPGVHRLAPRTAGLLLALLPVGLTLHFARFLPTVTAGGSVSERHDWVPALGVQLSFHLDGLALLFTLLVTGMGAVVLAFSNDYLGHHRGAGRFYALLLLFMASMLGVVLADNALGLFVFWELTTISSFLLIGFDHEREEARAGAQEALLITTLGGLAMLAGLLLLGEAADTSELSTLRTRGELVRAHPRYLAFMLLVVVGALSKSAQVPFHRWLLSAMAAPTPVSAYLHSATMVNAGIYLLARLTPVLGGTTEWSATLTTVGAATMLTGALVAPAQHDLKRLLASSTISALGALTMLLGIPHAAATQAALVLLLAHALYKGALFLVVGMVDHGAGSRDARELGGLRAFMPRTTLVAVTAGLSMVGVPPLLGFLGKESLLDAVLRAPWWGLLVTVVAAAKMFDVAAALVVVVDPFFGRSGPTAHAPHDASPALWLTALVPAAGGLAAGALPGMLVEPWVLPALRNVGPHVEPAPLELWHGFTSTLALSVATVAGGVLVWRQVPALRDLRARWGGMAKWGPGGWYPLALRGVFWLARTQTRALQTGRLRSYVFLTALAAVGLVGGAALTRVSAPPLTVSRPLLPHEVVTSLLLLSGAVFAATTTSRQSALASLAVVGLAASLLFTFFGAPDLGITQVLVDILTVIMLLLAFRRLPGFHKLTSLASRLRDVAISLALGGVVAVLLLAAQRIQVAPAISSGMVARSVPEAHGRNVVNVILVDFRALDTLGEITVLALAAVGVHGLVKLRTRMPGRA